MHYVIIRDDDTNALTPPGCLERLYRPFLDRHLPVNLAVIPEVRTSVTTPEGRREGFLFSPKVELPPTIPIGQSQPLMKYLLTEPGYHVLQHGCYHDCFEFDLRERGEILRRLDRGAQRLCEAGFRAPRTFVAPHDKLSRRSLLEVARRFKVLSTGWFELQRLPLSWWPAYAWKKLRARPHWRAGGLRLLSHPGCLLSCHRPYEPMLRTIEEAVTRHTVTVLVTHWWEYFRNGVADEAFIHQLHQTAEWLAGQPDVRVVSFEEVAEGKVPFQSN